MRGGLQTEIESEFDFGMRKIKGAYLPIDMSFPRPFRDLRREIIGTEDAQRSKRHVNMTPSIWTWRPKQSTCRSGGPWCGPQVGTLRCRQDRQSRIRPYANIITNMMMERLASPNGPTKGRIHGPPTRKAPDSVAFVQCAGSRDENHLPYCSYICCMASLKQATYVREQYPGGQDLVFYIDMRAPGQRYEKFYRTSKPIRTFFSSKARWPKSMRCRHRKRHRGGRKCCNRGKDHQTVEMVVLATGMQPTLAKRSFPRI